jgi:hypothetical protein
MREIMGLQEAAGRTLVVVDVQPAYAKAIGFAPDLMKFVNAYRGPVLMFVNAEETGVSEDSKDEIAHYWIENGLRPKKLLRCNVIDKGYGYLRAWMEYTDEETILFTIRYMIEHDIHDSREIEETTGVSLQELLSGHNYSDALEDDPLIVNWLDADMVRNTLQNCILCGGGRNECLAEVRIMFEALGVRYSLLDQFVY